MSEGASARRERPAAVLVMGILNLVFGGLGLAYYLCCGGLAMLLFSLLSKVAIPGGNPISSFPKIMDKNVPGFIEFFIAAAVVKVILAICLIVAGFGLLTMKSWGRYLSIFYAIVTIITVIGGQAFQMAYVNPRMPGFIREWEAEMMRIQQAQGGGKIAARPAPTPAPVPLGTNPSGSVFGLVIGSAYSIALLIVMFLPHVIAAFAGVPTRLPDEYFRASAGERELFGGSEDTGNRGDDPPNHGYRPRRPNGGNA